MFIWYAVGLNTCCPDYKCSQKYELTSIRGLVDKIEHVCGTCCFCTISTSLASLRSYNCFSNHTKLWCTYSINIGASITMKFLEFWDKLFFHPDVDPKSSPFLYEVLPNPGRKFQNPLQKCITLYVNA